MTRLPLEIRSGGVGNVVIGTTHVAGGLIQPRMETEPHRLWYIYLLGRAVGGVKGEVDVTVVNMNLQLVCLAYS